MFYGYEIRNAIKTRLDSELNNTLADIRTEHSSLSWISELVDVQSIVTAQQKGQPLPEVLFGLGDEIITVEQTSVTECADTDVYSGFVIFSMKSTTIHAEDLRDFYIEGIRRTLNEYNIAGITWVRNTGVQRYDNEQDLSFKHAIVQFEIRIN